MWAPAPPILTESWSVETGMTVALATVSPVKKFWIEEVGVAVPGPTRMSPNPWPLTAVTLAEIAQTPGGSAPSQGCFFMPATWSRMRGIVDTLRDGGLKS